MLQKFLTKISDFIKKIFYEIPYEYRPDILWKQLKCWIFRPYTTIKPRYLPHTWADKSTLIPHLIFEALSLYIENEKPNEVVNWYSDDEHKHAYKEMTELYSWWHNIYIPWTKDENKWDDPDILDFKIEKVEGSKNYQLIVPGSPEQQEKHAAALDKMFNEEEKMRLELIDRCKRVCEIKDFLWT